MSEYVVTMGDGKKTVMFGSNSDIQIDGTAYQYKIIELSKNDFVLKIDNKTFEISAEKKDKDHFLVYLNGKVIGKKQVYLFHF